MGTGRGGPASRRDRMRRVHFEGKVWGIRKFGEKEGVGRWAGKGGGGRHLDERRTAGNDCQQRLDGRKAVSDMEWRR